LPTLSSFIYLLIEMESNGVMTGKEGTQ